MNFFLLNYPHSHTQALSLFTSITLNKIQKILKYYIYKFHNITYNFTVSVEDTDVLSIL